MTDKRRRDRAIEQMLRRGAVGRRESPAPGTCVDGEMLAAWSSGALHPADGARVEEHVADCVRCQSMLAAFVRTTPDLTAPAPWWQRAQVRWLMPLATAATVAVVWVALPQRDAAPTQPVEMRERAEAEQPSAPARPEARGDAVAPGSRAAQTPPATGAAQSAAAKPKSARETRAAADSFQRREKVDDTADKRIGGAATGQQAAAPPAAPAPPPPAARPRVEESVTDTANSLQLLARTARFEIVSPGGTTRWRIVGGRQVQRSTDEGVTWEAVTLPGARTVTAGHSPSATVAWFVGTAGTIYVTADGTRFEPVPFVSSTDLASVVAVDDRQATVTTVDGRVFRTTDRGVSWAER